MTRKMKNMAIRNNQEKWFMENFILKFESFIEVAKDPDWADLINRNILIRDNNL